MKSVILFRHGKSDWNANYDHDHNRPLAKRGIRDAKRMGSFLSKIVEIPDLIISSTALRAKKTIELALENNSWSVNIIYEKGIYEASLRTLIDFLKKQENKYQCICLVGHEPILSSIIEKVKDKSKIKFPTAAVAKISFDTIEWNKIKLSPNQSELKWFFKPKDLNQ